MAQQDGDEEELEEEQNEPEIVGEDMEMEDEGEEQYDQPINIDGQGE